MIRGRNLIQNPLNTIPVSPFFFNMSPPLLALSGYGQGNYYYKFFVIVCISYDLGRPGSSKRMAPVEILHIIKPFLQLNLVEKYQTKERTRNPVRIDKRPREIQGGLSPVNSRPSHPGLAIRFFLFFFSNARIDHSVRSFQSFMRPSIVQSGIPHYLLEAFQIPCIRFFAYPHAFCHIGLANC